jgi:hypothetical protein
MTNATSAIDEFLACKFEIDTILERLAALSAEHFNVAPGEINWGHVGDLERTAARLREISDSAFGEGEYAD